MEPELFDPSEFSVTSGNLDGSIIVTISGELDMTTSPQLEQTLAVCNGNEPVVVDMTRLTFIDSSGLHVLLQRRSNGRPSALVVKPNSHVARVLDIVAAHKSVFVCPDVQTALADSAQSDGQAIR